MTDKKKVRVDEGNPPKPSPVLTQQKRVANAPGLKTSNTQNSNSDKKIQKTNT